MKKASLKTHRIIRACACLVILASILVALKFVRFTNITDMITAIGYEPSEALQQIIDRLSLTSEGERVLRGTRAELQDAEPFNSNCSSIETGIYVLGCYNSGRIYIYNIEERDLDGVRESTLAHELLHAVWARMTDAEREELRSSLEQVASENQTIRDHLKLYDDKDYLDELHSIAGAQLPREQLPEPLQKHYKKYFTDQDRVASFYEAYAGRYRQIEKRLDELKAEIETRREALQIRTDNYNQSLAEYEKRKLEFNARAENGYFTSESEFNAQRDVLVKQGDEFMREYAAIGTETAEINLLINEYNDGVLYGKKLVESLDSKAKKLED